MNIQLNKALVIFYSHFLLYPVYLKFISNTPQQVLIFGFLMIYAFINFNQIKSLFQNVNRHKKEIIISIIIYTSLIIFSIILPIIYRSYDFSYLDNYIRTTLYLLSYLVLLAMIRNLYGDSNLKNKLIEIFVKVTRNYVIVSMLFLTLPQVKKIWLSIIRVTETHISLLNNPAYITRIGWVGYSGFTLTIFCTISVVFSIYLLIDDYKDNHRFKIDYLISLFISIIGNAFYGRSGLAISLLMIFLGVLYIVLYYKKFNIIFYMLSGIVLIFISFSVIKNYNETFLYWYNWLMEPIISFRETGVLQTSSTNTLIDMWFIPDLKTLLIGDGYYTDPVTNSYYMDTDVGYLRPVLFYGVILTTLSYLIPTILGLIMTNKNKENNFLIFTLLLTMFIFEVKGEVFLVILPIMLILLISHSVDNNNHNVNSKIFKNNKNHILLGEKHEYYMG